MYDHEHNEKVYLKYERLRVLKVFAVSFLFGALVAVMLWAWDLNSRRFIVTCADFRTQSDAQVVLPIHPELDGDKDGSACDTYPYKALANDPRTKSP